MNNARLVVLLALVVTLLALVGAFMAGRATAVTQLEERAGSAHSLRQQLDAANASLAESRGQLAMLETRHAVDRQALEMVRSEIATLKEEVAELEEGLGFYQRLMAPESGGEGISIRSPELVAIEPGRLYGFRLVVLQEARRHELVQGDLAVSVSGLLAGEPATFSLEALSAGLENDTFALKFRYFQSIEGELALPDAFAPESLNLVVSTSKPRSMEVARQFDWSVKERFSNVGQ